MPLANTQVIQSPWTAALAKEIAIEVARILSRSDQHKESDNSKGLHDVQPVLFNIEQAAKYIGRTTKAIRDLERKGILKPVRFDRKIQFKKRDLDEAIERHSV